MLKGKVAIITGSSAGIGAEIAYKFSNEGADGITLHGRRPEALQNVKKRLIKGGFDEKKIHTVLGDITNEDTRKNLIEQTVSHFGHLDILVNNAGIFKTSSFVYSDITKSCKEHFDTNFHSVVALMHSSLAALKESKGNIVNISSSVAFRLFEGSVAYAAAIAALNHVTKAAALEFGPYGVRANVICPGYIPGTDIQREGTFDDEYKQKVDEKMKASTPLGRHGTPQDVANAVAFLASDSASYLTGVALPVDGGWHLA